MLDKWDAYDRFLAEVSIPLSVEAMEEIFLEGDALAKKNPAHIGVYDSAYGVAKHQLRPNSPVEPAEIGRMPKDTINSRGNKAVALVMRGHYLMRKVLSTLPHTNGPHSLSGHENNQAQKRHTNIELHFAAPPPQLQGIFHPCCDIRQCIINTMIQQEAVVLEVLGLLDGRNEKLGKVEEAQTNDINTPLRQSSQSVYSCLVPKNTTIIAYCCIQFSMTVVVLERMPESQEAAQQEHAQVYAAHQS